MRYEGRFIRSAVFAVRFRIEHGPSSRTYRQMRKAGFTRRYSFLLARGLDGGLGT